MKTSTYIYTRVMTGAAILLFPFMVGCSVLGGGGYSDDPAVRAQQMEIESLERDVEEAERYAEEAEEREKAAKDRLEAAKHELKALKAQAERRGY